MTKKVWQSKTFWLGILIMAGGVAEFIAGLPAGASIATITAGIISIVVRFLTNTKVTLK